MSDKDSTADGTTRQDIIAMAAKCGMIASTQLDPTEGIGRLVPIDWVERFAALVAAKEWSRIRPSNLLPQKEGQGSMMTITDGPDTSPPEVGHWYSPDKVASMLLADRQRLAADVELPESKYATTGDIKDINEFTRDQLREYGDRRAAAEREKAAQMCEHLRDTTLAAQSGKKDDLSNIMLRQIAHTGCGACAEEIREMGQQ